MSLPDRRSDVAAGVRKEKRTRKRWHVSVTGKIFVPARQIEGDCVILDLSPGGAGLKSACTAALGARVVVYIHGFGRYEGSVVQRDRLRVGVQFECSDAKRARIAQLIASYIEHGKVVPTSLRELDRTQHSEALQNIRFGSGRSEACEVVDMALSGALLKTRARPAVGEEVYFGSMVAVVARHTDVGIGVKFIRPNKQPPLVSDARVPH